MFSEKCCSQTLLNFGKGKCILFWEMINRWHPWNISQFDARAHTAIQMKQAKQVKQMKQVKQTSLEGNALNMAAAETLIERYQYML